MAPFKTVLWEQPLTPKGAQSRDPLQQVKMPLPTNTYNKPDVQAIVWLVISEKVSLKGKIEKSPVTGNL